MDMATETPEAGDGYSGEVFSGNADIMIVGFNFSPSELHVTAGTTVRWRNTGDFPHTVTADNAEFDSGNMENGDSFEFTFDQPGTYAYFCAYHGSAGGNGMSGVVIVE
jgi:plastocyanin